MSSPAGQRPAPGPSMAWGRRFSNPAIPTFAQTIPNLRAALLGYIGELERALRDRLGSDMTPPVNFDPASLSDTSSEDGVAFASSSRDPSTSPDVDIRRRVINPPLSPGAEMTLLRQLSIIREDVTAYLPQKLPAWKVNKDWLRSLSTRLNALDARIPLRQSEGGSAPAAEYRPVEIARKKVVEMVQSLLPTDDWAGWERLGWSENDDRPKSSFSARDDRGDETEDEPEYLFPNRTPASARAFAQTRMKRSKSVGAPSIVREWTIQHDARTRAGQLQRAKTYPGPDDLPSDDEDDLHEAEILLTPDIMDQTDPLLSADKVAPHVGPTRREALAKSADGTRLIKYDDLPFIWRNNEHIHTGYRFIPMHAKTGPIPLVKSAMGWHNETINIHSHFVPTLLILALIPTLMRYSPLTDAHPLDTAMLAVYFFAAVSCLFSSASWHVISGSASKPWFEWGACVDYIGISWLIAASFGTVVYNGFYCQPTAVLVYSATNFFCGSLGSYLPFQRWFNERKNKKWRIAFFLFLCFAMVAPMVQILYEYGWTRGLDFLSPFGISILTYIAGLLFYGFHVPECIYPGRFDYIGHSHQIWHGAIILAIYLHYRAVLVAHDARFDYSCAAPGAGRSVAEVVEGWWRLLVGANGISA